MRRRSLFFKLLTSFLIILMIPVCLVFLFNFVFGNKNLLRSLKAQGKLAVDQDAAALSSVLDEYRHKAYQLSTDPLTIQLLGKGEDAMDSEESRQLYTLMFSTMKGDTYLANANIVSSSGKIRFSTHDFPSIYDLRYHTNETEPGSLFSLLEGTSLTASTISIRGRTSTGNNETIIATIIRQVYDAKGNVVGYVIIELFSGAADFLNQDYVLSDEILVNPTKYYASSLLHANVAGSYEKFPELSDIPNLNSGVISRSHKILCVTPLSNTDLLLVGSLSTTPYEASMRQLILIILITLAAGVALSVLCASLFSRSIARPVKELVVSMKKVEQGNLSTQVADANIEEFAQLDHSFNTMVSQITSLMELTREEEAKLAEAERHALESQMNPHFLFNTLNTIKALAKIHHEDQIYTITLKLGKLLRSTVDNHESECSIKESMELVDSYLTIQKIRFGEKLHVALETEPECLDAMTPKLIIQPMVENAIGHGLEPKAGDWNLLVRIWAQGEILHIIIKDDGIGFDRATLPSDLGKLEGSGHVGIYNVYRRLKLRFKDEATMTIESDTGKGTVTTMTMPLIHKTVDSEEGEFLV